MSRSSTARGGCLWSRGPIGAVLVALALISGPSPALAAPAVESGWWTVAPVVAAPDATADALLVQGGPASDGTAAYAAVAFALGPRESPTSLRLSVREGSASTPNSTLMVCPLVESFRPNQGGPMEEAPDFDCAIRSIAAPSTDGTTYAFDLTALGRPTRVALAILPTAPTDRVVLGRPNQDSLATSVESSDSTVPPPTTSSPNSSDVPSPRRVVDQIEHFDTASPSPVASPAPSGAAMEMPTVVADTSSVRGPADVSRRPAAEDLDEEDLGVLGAAIFTTVAFVTVALWLYAGRRRASPEGRLDGLHGFGLGARTDSV